MYYLQGHFGLNVLKTADLIKSFFKQRSYFLLPNFILGENGYKVLSDNNSCKTHVATRIES